MLDAHHAHHHMDSFLHSADALQWAGFASIFTYSFLVSLHCVGMCGPLACSLVFRTRLKPWVGSALYNLGRIVSYTLAGAIASLLLGGISESFATFGQGLAVLLGAWICLFALAQVFGFKLLPRSVVNLGLAVRLQRRLESLPPAAYPFALGFFTLLLPCMTLHPLLFMAAAQQDPAHGAATMLAFGLGTLPAMLSATYMPQLAARIPAASTLRKLGYLFLFFAGLVTIWRAWPMGHG